jgi:uncharacterized membrane protein
MMQAGTVLTDEKRTRRALSAPSLAPDRTERVLGWLTLVMLGVVLAAIARGHAEWSHVPALVWLHLATMSISLAVTPAILWHPRGTTRHRVLGYLWIVSLAATALLSFWIRLSNHGRFSVIHLLSAFVLVMLPIIVSSARSHNHQRHRRAVRGLVIGALLVAGFFTFPFGRMLGSWLFGS